MASLLWRVEQARLRRRCRIARGLRSTAAAVAGAPSTGRVDLAVAKVQRQQPRRARVAPRAISVLPARLGHPDEAALDSGRSGWASSAIRHSDASCSASARDALVDQLAAKPAGDEVQVGARMARARGERARQPLAELVEPLRQRREQRLRLAASGRRSARSARGRARRGATGIAARDAASSASCANSSARTGTAISAAAVGVGARRSAAKSISVVSVSWPTAEISGIGDSAAARTTSSSLNAHRSSIEPPPRATISRSGRGSIDGEAADRRRDLRRRALALDRHRPDDDMRRAAVLEPVEDVADHRAGRRGDDADHPRQERQLALARGVEQPFGGQRPAALSSSAISAPSPASSIRSTTI